MTAELPDGAELVPLEVVRASDRDWDVLFHEEGWRASDCNLDDIPFEMMIVARRKPVDLDNDAGRCLVAVAAAITLTRRVLVEVPADLRPAWDAACVAAINAEARG